MTPVWMWFPAGALLVRRCVPRPAVRDVGADLAELAVVGHDDLAHPFHRVEGGLGVFGNGQGDVVYGGLDQPGDRVSPVGDRSAGQGRSGGERLRRDGERRSELFTRYPPEARQVADQREGERHPLARF
jgi:hypothetical protein